VWFPSAFYRLWTVCGCIRTGSSEAPLGVLLLFGKVRWAATGSRYLKIHLREHVPGSMVGRDPKNSNFLGGGNLHHSLDPSFVPVNKQRTNVTTPNIERCLYKNKCFFKKFSLLKNSNNCKNKRICTLQLELINFIGMTRTRPPRRKPARNKTGPKSKCTPEVIAQTEALCKVGLTNWQLARYFEVSEDSITYWKRTIPAFASALNRGRLEADTKVAESLYQRAIGYSHDAIQFFKDTVTEKEFDENGNVVKERSYGRIIQQPYVKHYPPETKAAIKILEVRHREIWGQHEQVHRHLVSGDVQHHHHHDAEYTKDLRTFTTEELEVIRKLGLNKQLALVKSTETG